MAAPNPAVPLTAEHGMPLELTEAPAQAQNHGAEAFKDILFGSVSLWSPVYYFVHL